MQPRGKDGPQQSRVLVRLVEEPGPAQEEPVPCQHQCPEYGTRLIKSGDTSTL